MKSKNKVCLDSKKKKHKHIFLIKLGLFFQNKIENTLVNLEAQ